MSRFPSQFHPNLPLNWDLPLSWSNNGAGCDPKHHATHNSCQSQQPNPPAETNRSYVFSSNGYPQCTQPEALAGNWNHRSYVCPDRAPIESFGDTIDTQATINDMEFASKLGKPFFLACGMSSDPPHPFPKPAAHSTPSLLPPSPAYRTPP